jgi:hypothetical protein
MIALLAVEWRRVLARRLVRVSAALAVLAVLAAGAITFLVSRDMDDASLAQAQAARQVEVQRCIAGQLEGVPADIPPQERAQFCEQGFIPPVPDRRFHYEHLPEILVGTSGFAIILGWLLGGALLPAGLLRGTTQAIDAGWLRSLGGVGLRVAAVSVVGATMGLSIATIGRNTAAALGIAFGYLAIVENAIRGLRPSWTPWLLGDNSVVVITNQPQNFPLLGRSTLGAAALVAGYTLALLAVVLFTFRRRDIA